MADRKKQIKVLILGIGNELLTDDGVGIHVIRRLQKELCVKGVVIAEAGTAVLHNQQLLEQAEHLIAVDAVRAGDKPGTIYHFDVDQAQTNRLASLHDLGVVGVLQLMPECIRPVTTIIGIEPEIIDYGMELSPSVQAAVPGVIQLIQEVVMDILSSKNGLQIGLVKNEIDITL